MDLKDNDEKDFILNIVNIPGSNLDVAKASIKYYEEKANNMNVPEVFRTIAKAYATNLKQYYEMANLESDGTKIREALAHFSEISNFMQEPFGNNNKNNSLLTVESAGRIKSFYSTYQKILDKLNENYEKNIESPGENLLQDIYATRYVFSPTTSNPTDFYPTLYEVILKYLEKIDSLEGYNLIPLPDEEINSLQKPKELKFDPEEFVNEFSIPVKDFIDYSLENKNIPQIYRYLAELPITVENKTLITEINKLKNIDLSTNINAFTNSALYKAVREKIQLDHLYEFQNPIEELLLDNLNDDAMEDDYYSLSLDEFMQKYTLKEYAQDCCNVLQYLRSKTNSDTDFAIPICSNKDFQADLKYLFGIFSAKQKQLILEQLQEIQDMPLDNFGTNINSARKIVYFSKCCKDYMKYPKASGYQSFHINIKAPFGMYETQIRTDKQHSWAEKGPASHANAYKPDVRSSFHRLKVPRPFVEKRNQNGEIIKPIQLGILPFDLSIKNYYGVPFEMFTGDSKITLKDFQKKYPLKEDFDKAFLALSVPEKTALKDKLAELLSRFCNIFSEKRNNNKSENTQSKSEVPDETKIPKDIASHNSSDDDSDPHDSDPHDSDSHDSDSHDLR